MLNKTKDIIKQIKYNSQRQIENIKLVEKYVYQSLEQGEVITFYNWECPPRFLDITQDGEVFINYDVNLKNIFKSKKVDKFTELPRVVEVFNEEKKILEFLNLLGIKYRFIKFVADTNAFYLTPRSVVLLGEQKIRKKFNEFKALIAQKIKTYPAETEV